MNIDTLAHALTARLLIALADDADEATLKAAMSTFPAIIREALEDAMKQVVAN